MGGGTDVMDRGSDKDNSDTMREEGEGFLTARRGSLRDGAKH